jgi:hypothetical protein
MPSQGPVTHVYIPSYSGGSDQEDPGSKQAQENSLWDPISNTPNTKNRACGVAQVVEYLLASMKPCVKPQYNNNNSNKKGTNASIYLDPQP